MDNGGWKSKLGAVIAGVGGLLKVFWPEKSDLFDSIANGIITLGGAMFGFGMRHAVSKAVNVLRK